MSWTTICNSFLLVLVPIANTVFGSAASVGPNGIDSSGLGLTGAGIGIGQVELRRPGDDSFDTMGTLFHSSVDPAEVFFRDPGPAPSFSATMNDPMGDEIGAHPVQVAGVIISEDATTAGVAEDAMLFSAGFNPIGPTVDGFDAEAAITAQHVATRNGGSVHAINFSFGNPAAMGAPFDGDSQLTLFVDWSARVHDTLYVVAGNETGPVIPIPTDNFNGLTVGFSAQVGGTGDWLQVDGGNVFAQDAEGDRTSISLIAPGRNVALATLGTTTTTPPHPAGTSFAAPHVTGTVALLQELATRRISAPASTWNATRARRHEVMKAVLMNSADKLIDDGSVMVNGSAVPPGGLLGMSRTVIDQFGNDWRLSEAYDDSAPEGGGRNTPLDDQMGAGHLNATRALQQFSPGEYDSDSGDVPAIGWDYGSTTGLNDINEYPLAGMLTANHFISITLAWDRHVDFATDVDMDGEFDAVDTDADGDLDTIDTFQESAVSFPTPDSDDLINNLELFLLPKGSFSISQAVAQSSTAEGSLQHIFFQIPTTDEYEIWVRQFDEEPGLPVGQDYAIAWWYGVAPPLIVQGDYNGDNIVDAEDYNVWRSGFGSAVSSGTGADGNGNGMIDAADYVVWRNSLSAGTGSGSLAGASVPEPDSAALILIVAGAVLRGRWRGIGFEVPPGRDRG